MKENYATNYAANADSQRQSRFEIGNQNSSRFVKYRLKSFILTLAIFVAGIGSLWGQVALITASDGGFENATSAFANNGWTAVGTTARTWRVGTFGGAATGTKAAYWGTATAYGGSAASAVGHFYRDITIPSGATSVFLNYKLKYPTIDNGWDYFYVFTTTTANTPANGVIPTTGYTNRFTNTATTYAGFTAMTQVDLSALAGTTVRLVFTFKTDAVAPNAAPVVDDITLTYICPTPTCPTLSAPANAATGISQLPTLSWTAGANTNTYDVYLSTNQTDVNNQAAGALVSSGQAGLTYSPASLAASTTYYWRVVPKNSCGNAGSACTTRSFTTAAPSPTLTVGTLTSFGNQCVSTTSAAGSFTISGINLTANVNIAALSGYSYCLTAGGTYTSTLSIPASGTLASTLVYVKFNPTAASAYNGNIVASSTGATSQNVAATGTGVNTTISTQPSSAAATYCTSGTATALTVAATAASGSAFSYQWYSNSSASTSGGTAVGTNAASYTPLTTTNGTLYYYCVVSGCGTAATSTVTGAISTGACINMSNGSTTLTGNANFYDNGGPSANYAINQAFTYTVYPASCNNVSAVFSSFTTESCCDYMIVYNGNSTSAPSLGTFYTMTANQTFNSTAADGSLTFYFYSDVSVAAAGWAAVLSNVPVSAGPAAPTGFAGTLNAEVGSTQTYSVTAVAGATYAWSFPAGWVINSGQGTNSVSVTVGGANGNISVTPTRCSIAGTAYTVATTIPNYRWAYVSSSLGSATWTGGEARNVSITIKNTGVGTWNSGITTNVAVRWDSDNSNAAFSPWNDYHSRIITGTVSPGSQVTCTLPIQAKNATSGPVYSTNLADGNYYLAFDLVNEGSCWFGGAAAGAGACTVGNSPWYSSVQTVSTIPTMSCTPLTAFGSVCLNSTATNSFTISGANLTSNVSVGALSGYTFSTTSNGTYTSTLVLTPTSGVVNQTVYVKFTPTAASAYTGNIVVSSTGASSQNVAASGSGISPAITSQPTANATNYCSTSIAAPLSITATVEAGATYQWYSNTTSSNIGGTAVGTNSTSYTPSLSSLGTLYYYCVVSTCGTTITSNVSGGISSSICMPASGSVTTCSGNFYDTGGSAGSYGNSESRTYTIYPGTVGNKVKVSFNSLAVETCCDNLKIYNGNSAAATLLGTYTASPGIITSTAADGSLTFVFTSDGSVTAAGWDATISCVGPPTVSFVSPSNACPGATVTLTGTGFTGSTGVTFNGVAAASYTVVSNTQITAVVPNSGTTGVIAVTNAAGSGSSSSYTINTPPLAPTVSVTGSTTINVGGTSALSSTGSNITWYDSPTGGTVLGTGGSLTTASQCSSGLITFYAADNNGCASTTRGSATITVRPMVTSNPSNALICSSGGSVTLSAQLTGGSAITWSPNTNLSTTSGASTVASPTATTVYTMSATVAGCGSVSGTQTVGVIDAVAFTPTSTPTQVCAGNPAVLASNLSSSGFTYSSMPFAPSTAVSPTILCNACGVDDGSADNIAIPFTYNFFGNNYTTVNIGTNGVLQFGSSAGLGQFTYNSGNFPNVAYPANVIAAAAVDLNFTSGILRVFTDGIAPTRKFVIEYLNVAGYSGGSNTVQIKLCETTGIVEIHVTNASAFGGSANKVVGLQDLTQTIGATAYSNTATITNTAWKFIPGANYTFQWATAGSNIGGATATTYTTPNLSTPGQVTYSVAATNPNTQCTTTQSVNITVNALPSAPNSSGNVTACSTLGNQTLAVTTGAGETADWFAASTGGTVLASGDNVLSYSTATAGTYYAAAQNTTTGCSSATRTGVTLNVNTSPAAPTVTTPVSYCQGAPATTLTATPTGSNTLNWYSAAPSYPAVTGATALGSAPTPSTSTTGTTNYYVSQSSSANSCESQLALVAVNVNAIPSAPVASNPAAYCQSAPASALTATATAGNTLYWYTVPTGGTGSTTAPTPSTATAGTTDYYVADRNNSSSCEGSRTTVTVTVNPTITASVSNSASSTSACGGGAITFTATPTNGGTPTYQWYLNNNPVGSNSATYTLTSPNNADAIYVAMTPSAQTCLASSAATNSNTVALTSTAATPTVSIQSSASTAFCPGTSVTFSVNASANMGASPGYQWNLNGTPIIGATNSTLVTTTLANSNQVSLTMTSSLSGACLTQSSATSSAITSTVNSSTAIATQPATAAACLGGSTSFTVSATGTGTLTYQWKKNGSNVTGNASATTSTLTLSGIAAGDAANYTVDVTGTCGTVSSSAAALTINSATAISAQPSAVTQCAGTTANFSVTGSGQGTLTYQWRKDGSALSGETNSTLAVANIATLNAGQYSVIVSGGCGNVTSSNALLTVNSGTSISTQPVASTLCAGNTVNFSVTASGTGALSYQWKKDGTNVGTNSATLSIANTQAANAGTYTVDVSSSCGALTSNNALLTVNPLTTITTQPVATSGCQGQNTTFTVVAAGTSPLTYQWKFGGVNISGATSTNYNITSTTTANDGAYLVAVTGGCGTAVNSNTVALNVYASPTLPASITTPDFTSTAMCGVNTVAISAASIGNDSQGQWLVVGSSLIGIDAPSAATITATAANSAMGGTVKKLVWEVSRETTGNFCYSRDTISIDFKQPVITPISSVVATGDLLWGGLTNTTWGTASNWYQLQTDGTGSAWVKLASGQPSSNNKTYTLSNSVAGACVSASNAPALATAGSSSSVYIGTGANMNLNAGNLTIQGNLVNNGSITPGTGTVTFNGTSTQTISGTGALANFNNLVINKASGTLTLSQPVRVAGTLTMTQGNIVTSSSNMLEIGSSTSSLGSVSWTAGNVIGPMRRWFAGATNSTPASGLFPVGLSTVNRYAQVNFTQAPGSGGYIDLEYKAGAPANAANWTYLTTPDGQIIQTFEDEGYWDITPYDASGNAYPSGLNTSAFTMKLRANGLTSVNDISVTRIIRSPGPLHTTWEPAGFHIAATGTSADFAIESNTITGFSWFNIGSPDNNALPVELLNFNGTCNEGMVDLTWQTASEFNSSHFDVEKSTDGETWRVVATIPSAGTSTELLTYQTVDNNGTSGSNYYRLRQVDTDGKEKLYNPINVSCVETTTGYFTSYPNPSGSDFQVVVNDKEILGACTLNIVDAQGKVIDQRTIEVKDGINMFVISEELNPGIYFLNITNGVKTTEVIRHAVK